MSLINDALRRANQSDKDRPRPAGTEGMAVAPVSRGSGLTIALLALVLLALIAAGWFFREWWMMRNSMMNQPAPAPVRAAASAPNVFPAVTLTPHPVSAVHKPAPVAEAKPVPAPSITAPAKTPVVVPHDKPVIWPELKLNAVFYSKSNPRVLINGSIYATGDTIQQDVILKKIDPNVVTLEMNGHTKTLMMGGQ